MSVDPARLEWAVALIFLASVCIPLGLSFIKLAYTEKKHPNVMRIMGAVLFFGGATSLYGADTFAPLVSVSPILATAILMNMAIATAINKETVMRKGEHGRWLFAFMLMVGCFATMVASSQSLQVIDDTPDVDLAFIITAQALEVALCLPLTFYGMWVYHRRSKDAFAEHRRTYKFAFPLCAGTMVSGACLAGRGIFINKNLGPLAVLVVLLSFAGKVTMALGLRYFEMLEIVPLFIAVVVVWNILGGTIMFSEWKMYTAPQIAFYFGGMLLVFGAMIQIVNENTYEPVPQQQEEEEMPMT